MRTHSATSSDTGSTSQRRARLADHVDAESGGHVDARARPSTNECSSAGGAASSALARGGADERQERARLGHVLVLHVAAERVGAEHVLEHGVPDRLGVEPEPVVAAQDPQVGAELALVGEDGGVAALPGRERLDVVRHLSLEEVRRLAAAHEELRAVGAVHQPGGLGDQLVVACGDHKPSVLLGATKHEIWARQTFAAQAARGRGRRQRRARAARGGAASGAASRGRRRRSPRTGTAAATTSTAAAR